MSRFLILCWAGLLAAAPACAENLLEVYRDALHYDPTYAAAQADHGAALEAVPQARAAFLPDLSAGTHAGQNYSKAKPNNKATSFFSQNDDEYFRDWGYSLDLTQAVFRRENFVVLRQADISVQQAGADLAAALQDLILRTATAYFDILAAEDNLKARSAELKAFQRQFDQATQRFEVGLIAITDVLEAQAARDSAVAGEIAAKNELSNSKEALRRITGRYYPKIAPIREAAPLISPEPADIDAWSNTALEQNLNLEATRLSSQLAKENIERARSGHYPTLDLVARYGHTDNNSNFGSQRDNASIGLQFHVSLYQGGRIRSQVRQAEKEYTAALDRLEEQRRGTDLSARNAYRAVQDRIAATKALEQAIVSTQSALEATEAGYEVGTRTIIDVINVQQRLSVNESDYSRVRSNYAIATLTLKQAAGQLSPEDVAKVNTWLQGSDASADGARPGSEAPEQ